MAPKQPQPDKAQPALRVAPDVKPAPREPSRMMGVLIVDVLAARKASPPKRAARRESPGKAERG